MKKGKILIVDDNEDILFTLKLLLRPLAESVTLLSDPRELLPVISRTRFDVILLDMNFRRDAVSGKEGFHWLEEILRLDAKAVVIFITAYADTEKAVQAIKQGATDFIPKPWQNEKLLATVSSALQLSFSRTEVEALKKQKEKLKKQQLPIPTYTQLLTRENSAKTCCTASIRLKSVFLLCVNGAMTYSYWPISFCNATRRNTGKTFVAFQKKHASRCSFIAGRET